MQLTNRQLFVLSYLLNHPQGISAEHLASQTGVSIRTLQSEIQEINQKLESGACIQSLGKRGYAVQGMTESAREKLLAQSQDRQSVFMPEERVNDIITVLLFTRGYTNLETIANQLYLSKASVYRVVETHFVMRRIVTVSRTKGLAIEVSEREKRQLLTKVFDKDAQNPIAQELGPEYARLDSLLRVMLINLFRRHHYWVSGEALRSFRRYLIITILRSRNGFPLEHTDFGLPTSSLMEEITVAIRSLVGVTFSPDELQDCQAKLNNLCTFVRDIPAHRMDWVTTWGPKFQCFLDTVRERYGIDLRMNEEDQQRFLLHVNKLARRVITGDHDANYHKREINRSYPLSVQLILLAFEECFGFPVPETEVSCLAMYVAMKLRRHFNRIDCIIVTAKHPSIAWPMKQWLEEHFSRHLETVEIVEHYRFNKSMVRGDILVLTTGESVVLSCPQAILVNPLRLDDEYDLIDHCIQDIRNRNKEDTFQAGLDRYAAGPELLDPENRDLYALAEHLGIPLAPGRQYEFVTDTDAFLLPTVHPGGGKNSIRIYRLKRSIFHRSADIKHLVVSDYYTDTNEMMDFYYCLQMLLRPGQLDILK